MSQSAPLLSLVDRSGLTRDLLAWFAAERRDLPWRARGDTYGIWISEVMLQQTTVQTVIPYWRRFMARFPDVFALAQATESEVLAHWSGLGYYSRGRNVLAAAKRICAEAKGRLPANYAEWIALPGVGPYTAGAIASIGLGERRPALDANARRVIMRWAAVDPDRLAAASPRARQHLIDELGTAIVPAENPGRWNEAVMELGALYCGARIADCQACPVAGSCRAALGGWVEAVPPPVARSAAARVWCGILAVTWRDRNLLYPSPVPALAGPWPGRSVARSDFKGLHTGLWGMPMTAWLADQTEPRCDPRAWLAGLDLPLATPADAELRKLGEFRHAITRYRLRVSVYEAVLDAHLELPESWLAETPGVDQPVAPGRFVSAVNEYPPKTGLVEKVIHLQQDSLV